MDLMLTAESHQRRQEGYSDNTGPESLDITTDFLSSLLGTGR